MGPTAGRHEFLIKWFLVCKIHISQLIELAMSFVSFSHRLSILRNNASDSFWKVYWHTWNEFGKIRVD